MTRITVPRDLLQGVGIELASLMVRIGWANSKTQARHHIRNGEVKVNDHMVVNDPYARITACYLVEAIA